ncbi:MAG: hypothetical protein ACRDWT_17300 [Jatrophihabitantaceae bacterium]
MSLVMGAVLTLADTNLRATVQLRDQTKDNYGADAAAQAAVTQLQNGKFVCKDPSTASTTSFGTASTPFYAPSQTEQGPLNASASCAPDKTDGANTTTTTTGSGVGIGGGDTNLPSYALLAMEPNSLSEGITFPQNNKTICIENGKVATNAAINATNNILGVRVAGTGSPSDCSTGSGTGLSIQAYGVGSPASSGCLPNKTTQYKPTPCQDMSSLISTPTAPKPDTTSIGTLNPAPVCKTKSGTTYAAFVPGKYTNVSLLNSPCPGGTDFEWFSPGTYFFDYGSTPWQWATTLVGGTPTSGPSTTNADGSVTTPAITGVVATSASSLPGLAGIASWPSSSSQHPNACADPSAQKQYPGIEFVFGGTSTFMPNQFGNAELCGTYDANNPPIAIYGTSSSSDVPGVSAETLCKNGASAVTCTAATPTANGTLINPTPNGQAQFYIKGFVYAPAAPITLNLKNSNGQIFNWGVVVWNFSLSVNGSSPTVPFIQLPSPNQGFTQQTTTTYTIRYINVWTCAASAGSCPQSGPPNATVKVQTKADGTSPKVLSWSEQR